MASVTYTYTATITDTATRRKTRLSGTYTAAPGMTPGEIKSGIRAGLPFEHLMYGKTQHIQITPL